MGVGRRREPDPLLDGELDDFVGGIKFVHWFAPTGSGELDGEPARGD